ncbi:MAG: T9SS type A sorting domain-containing protein [Bacteroidetes bacterium]|nr:T9SS type A sorting domain-containing protein [Bacteroidota bacterium]
MKLASFILLSTCVLQVYSQTFSKVYNYDGGSSAAWSIRIVHDGYVAVGDGWIVANDGWQGLQILKVDTSGDKVYFKGYGEEGVAYYSGYIGSATVTPDTGVAISGIYVDSSNNTKMLLVKFDKNGDTLFTRKYGSTGTELGRQCRMDSEGNFVLLGEKSFGANNKDYYLIRSDSIGNKLWDTTYGGFDHDVAESIEPTEKGFIIAGGSDSYGPGETDAYIIEINEDGEILWSKTYGTPRDDCGGIVNTFNNSFILKGCLDTNIILGDYQYPRYVAKLDSQGNMLWRTFFNGPELRDIRNISETMDGNIVVVGTIEDEPPDVYHGWISKVDSVGNILWERRYYKLISGDNIFYDVQETVDSGFIISGTAFDSTFLQGMWLVKLDKYGCLIPGCQIDTIDTIPSAHILPKPISEVRVYPNPTASQLYVDIPPNYFENENYFNLFDVTGKSVLKDIPLNGENPTSIILNRISNGLYFYTIGSNQRMITRGKISVMR